MPNQRSCKHLERVEMMVKLWENYMRNNSVYSNRSVEGETWNTHLNSFWISDSSIGKEKSLELYNFLHHLKCELEVNIGKCNCENIEYLKRRISELESSSSSQLVLRRNAETDLSVVQKEKDNLQFRIKQSKFSIKKLWFAKRKG